MRLRLILPSGPTFDGEVGKVVAEDCHGVFCLKPRALACIAVLVPGLLVYVSPDGTEHFVALDGGLLVKSGDVVTVTMPHAVTGVPLGRLRDAVRESKRNQGDREARADLVQRRIEAGFRHRLAGLESDDVG